MKKIPMKFSDTEFGTDEYGYIPAIRGEDPDDADMRYTKHLRDQGVRGRLTRWEMLSLSHLRAGRVQ